MEEFKVDLTNCDREPIHIPGKIQSHGFLLAFEASSQHIKYATDNINAHTGITAAEALKLTLPQFIAQQKQLQLTLADIRQLQQKAESSNGAGAVLPIAAANGHLNLIVHPSGNNIILEFEPMMGDMPQLDIKDVINDWVTPLQGGLTLNQLLPLLAQYVKKLIGYDRVMVYKYWEDWHGEVVAEEKRDDLEPFLGLHYPASDIPKQARELYVTNLVRGITDVDAPTAEILQDKTGTPHPLDLTHATLRAVSPMHVQYLKNMGVRASVSISLLYKGQLWGLIACHHYSPRFIDCHSREACKLLAQVLSTSLGALIEDDQITTGSQYKEEADHIFETLYRSGDVPVSLINGSASILRVNNATGVALVFEKQVYTLGNTPTHGQIAELVQWLARNAPNRLYHTTSLPKFYGKATQYSHVGSGIMAIELYKSDGEYVIWFKPELNQTVKWAGKPEKPIEVDATGATRLTPRQSFAVWYEEIKHTSEQWNSAEILTALRLREGILQVVSQKANETRKLNGKLKEAYDELDTFSHTISHDLRTPISVIKNYAEILMEEYGQLSPTEAKQILGRIVAGADQMDELIKGILAYSKLGNLVAPNYETIEMHPLLQELVQQAQLPGQTEMVGAVSIGPTPNITAPRLLVRQIFANLIENAIKYSSKQAQPRITIQGKSLENEVVYQVSDNGIGIDAAQSDKVFTLFKRMDNALGYEGTGIGLATIKRLIKKLGGRVWFDSELNKGTDFYVTFPLTIPNDQND